MGNYQRRSLLLSQSLGMKLSLGLVRAIIVGLCWGQLIFDPNAVTLQIHNFDLYSDEHRINEKDFSRNNSVSPLYEGIRVPAIRLPDKVFASKYDVQSQKENNKKSDFLGDLEDENEE